MRQLFMSRVGAGLFGAIASSLLFPGCVLLDDLGDGESLINAFASHHGTPDADGDIPMLGGEGYPRVFETDLGFEVHLTEAYVTTVAVAVHRCNGAQSNIDMFWGPCAENFIDAEDGNVVGLGAVTVPDGQYCSVSVLFGNYDPAAVDPNDPAHDQPETDEMIGQTFLLAGYVQLEDTMIPFHVTSSVAVQVTMPIGEGGSISIEDESVPVDLTIGKDYQYFFDGVDFLDFEDVDLENAVLAGLEMDTRVIEGTEVRY